MSNNYRSVLLTSLLLFMAWLAPFALARPPQRSSVSFKAVHVIGLQDAKHNAKGKLTISKDTLEFTSGSTKNDLPIASIQDALTGADSQRMIGGTIGFLTNFAPYESGRFLSLFRTKIDTLTISYRDSGGGLHGAIFTLPQGQAAVLKRQLVAQGAKTSIPAEEEASQQTNGKKGKEKNQ